MAWKPFQFVIPTLPVETYRFVQRVCKGYEMTPWQVVIAALLHLERAGTLDREQVGDFLARAKEAYPHKRRASE